MADDASSHSAETLAAAQVRYSVVAITLHWTLALALAFQIALGFAMPDGPQGFDEYQLHKSFGIAILLLTVVRLAWKFTHRPPPPVEGGWEGGLAKAVHTGFYLFLIGAPLTGWAIVSAARVEVPTVVFGVLPWPDLPIGNGAHDVAEELHEWLSWAAIGLFLLHVAGALRHHLLLRDALLRRMAPGGSTAVVGVLAVLTIGLFFATGMVVAGDGVAPDRRVAQTPSKQRMLTRPASDTDVVADAAEQAAVRAEQLEEEEAEAAEEATEEVAEAGPPPQWSIQPGGTLSFTVAAGGETYRGSFADWSGAIRFDPDNPDSAEIRIDVALTSASLGDATMDGMLQGAEFFASGSARSASWRSTRVRRTGADRYAAQGTLSLKGASRAQPLSFSLTGEGLRRRVQGTATIDRTAFGIGTGDAGQGLDRSVTLNFAFDAVGRAP